ncbi:MAG: OmpA family protein [Desulfomicrobium sp.]|nr:OmpA family protein [Desulfomicrobium sp.]
MKLSKFLVMSLVLVLCVAANALAAENYVRKVDNFMILVDRSGSMDKVYVGSQDRKIVTAKSILERMNAMIPELGYLGALSTAAPYGQIQDLATFSVASYGESIAQIPTLIGSNPTPLGAGLKGLEPMLQAASGKTAVIVVSDGQENVGEGSVQVASALAEKYNVCFHTISFADTVDGNQALLDQISALNSCGIAASAAALAEDAALQQFVKDVFYDIVTATLPEPVKVPVKRVINVLFDFDKADIKPAFHQELVDFATFAKQYPGVDIEIAGHTDSIGTPEYNQKLSQRRANSVRSYLIEKCGMDGARLTAVGYGLTQPVADNTTDAGRAQNRRVEGVLKGVYEEQQP